MADRTFLVVFSCFIKKILQALTQANELTHVILRYRQKQMISFANGTIRNLLTVSTLIRHFPLYFARKIKFRQIFR